MPRGANPFYHAADEQLGAALGMTLGRALFGDPDARAEMLQRQAKLDYMSAQSREALARGDLYGAQTEAERQKTAGSQTLADLFRGLAQPNPEAQPTIPSPPGFDPADPLAPLPAPTITPDAVKSALPAMIAAMALARGDKLPVAETLAQLPAYFGDDELARRSMVAQGHSPSENFALTPDRADAISARDAGEDKDRALAVEGVRSGDRRYGVDVRSSDTRRGQDIASSDRRRGQDIGSEDRHYAVDNKGYDRAGAIALGNTLGTVTSTVRDPAHNKRVGGVSNSYHLPSRGGRGIDIARKPGVSHAQVVQAYRNAGYTILEQLDEGDHSHLALAGAPGGGKGGGKPAAPKAISAATAKVIDKEVDDQLAANGLSAQGKALANIRISAQRNFQRGGSPAEAAASAIEVVKRRMAQQGGKPAPKQAAAPQSGGKPSVDSLRQQALAAIGKGADPAKVRARFKQMTGQDLKGV